MPNLTDKEITNGINNTEYTTGEPLHQSNDCIRIAYEWLDAQKKIKSKVSHRYALKHIIENWGGRYVSSSDVEVAANLHPDIKGSYPFYNISSMLTDPSIDRLTNIKEAMIHKQYRDHHPGMVYRNKE